MFHPRDPDWRTKVVALIVVAVLHLAAVLGLIQAFAPDLTAKVQTLALTAFAIASPKPSPTPKPPPAKAANTPAGGAGAAGKHAIPKAISAPKPKVVLSQDVAPQAASTGAASTSGARDAGAGTGAGGAGNGTGSGTGGNGQGGGGPPIKIAGEINSAKDYPLASRDARIGDYVIIALTVGTNGRASDCRVVHSSKDSAANAITCDLAKTRFRFRPASDGAGNPVLGIYGWKQSWHY